MSTVILLSSSPPRVFARSPTPATSSSPLPSPSSILKTAVEGRKKFKTVSVQCDGFSGGITTASALLRTKVGAENVQITALWKENNTGDAKILRDIISGQESEIKPAVKALRNPSDHIDDDSPRKQSSDKENRPGKSDTSKSTAGNVAKSKERAQSPLLLDKASSRRLDWTPPVPSASAPAQLSSPLNPLRTFPGDLLRRFEYSATDSQDAVTTQRDGEGAVTKRRRIELFEMVTRKAAASMSAQKTGIKLPTKPAVIPKKRSKPPVKKATTITGLATSNYLEHELGPKKANPMLQFMSSTQARATDDSEEPAADTAGSKAKRVAKNPRKSMSKFRVLSPESAMKALDSQEMMFGSASQLARDESPTFIRDTLEAIMQSESFLMTDPISTQMSQPISIESTTPRAKHGTARFTRTRNLWAAAGRDEDNALLHVDTVDLFDTPALKSAFAGKDVLLEPALPARRVSKSPEQQSPSLYGGTSPTSRSGLLGFYEIRDVTTAVARVTGKSQPLTHPRHLHTVLNIENQQGSNLEEKPSFTEPESALLDMARQSETEKPAAQSQAAPKAKSKPKKPSYKGFATQDLQKQISAYGFKPIKKREKMIEILDRCWADKHGEDATTDVDPILAESIAALTHGDFLSKVHDISSRPVPKVKKPRASAKKAEAESADSAEAIGSTSSVKKKAKPKPKSASGDARPKNPHKCKPKVAVSAEESVVDVDEIALATNNAVESSKSTAYTTAVLDDSAITPKVKAKLPRKRKSNAITLPEEIIVDVSDIEDSTSETANPKKATAPKEKTPATAACQLSTTKDDPLLSDIDPAPTAHEPTGTLGPKPPRKLPLDSQSSSPCTLPDISTQITRAIATYTPSPGRDHLRNPTWHEKILLYDPIVLEDLAAWLNTEGLRRIGEDREVGALEVRSWCEARGVCCLWQGGWRANGSGRGQGD